MRNLAEPFRQLFLLAGAAIGLLLLTACGPSVHSYRYISLEGEAEANVIERAQATPGTYRLFVGEIPTHYEIKRGTYTLTLIVHPASWNIGVAVKIHPYPDHRIGFHHKAERNLGPCAKWDTYNQGVSWVYGFYQCDDPAPWQEIDKHLRFTVFDQHGTVVAEEVIPYTVKRDGFYGYFDAI